MSRESFTYLLENIQNRITHGITHKQPISADERLALTLRYLAHGGDQLSVAHSYHMSPASVSNIVREVCAALTDFLFATYVKPPNMLEWIQIENKFREKFGFPNCLGSIDGKHCAIKAPPNSGSLYFNYKGYFSILLLAVADAEYVFRLVVIGDYGSTGDAAIFSREIKDRLESNKFKFPPPAVPPGHDKALPHVLVGDQAFPLQVNLMKPFPESKAMGEPQEIFNIRLCTARRTVECSFGMLATVWRVLSKRMEVLPETADKIIRACIGLHNFLRMKESLAHEQLYNSLNENSTTTVNMKNVSNFGICKIGGQARQVRDEFVKYFGGNGAVSWQTEKAHRGRLVLREKNRN